MNTDEVTRLVFAAPADIVDALEAMRKKGLVDHTMLHSQSRWQRRAALCDLNPNLRKKGVTEWLL